MKKNQKSAILRACEIAGSQAALSRILNVRTPTVSDWVFGRRPIPPERCYEIEKATGVTRKELRPDDWAKKWPELAMKSS